MPIVSRRSRRNHDETTPRHDRPDSRMDLIQLQKYSDRARFPVHSRRSDKIEGVRIYTIRTVTYTRAQCARIHTRISVHGLINWITLTRRPPGTREHPALRKETGHSKRLSSSIRFPSISLPPLLFLRVRSLPSPPPPSSSSSSHDLVSFAGDRIRRLTDGNHDPLCPSRGLRRFQPGIPLTFRMFG